MKGSFLFALLLIGLLLLYFVLLQTRNDHAKSKQATSENPITNMVAIGTNEAAKSNIQASNNLFVATSATNLAQWKSAIKGFKDLGFTFDQKCLVEQHGRTNGLPLLLQSGGKSAVFKAILIEVDAKNISGNVYEADMQSENMSIVETRKLGLKLCDMYGCNSEKFLQWCDMVGNRWQDQPLFSVVLKTRPEADEIITFATQQTYDNRHPWLIDFTIQYPSNAQFK